MSDLDILLGDEFRHLVETNLDRDPILIALDKNLPHAALVASQVKYLRRAARKLPSYHAARCVLPALAFQQSSSERTAARKNYSGTLAIDLTCGLGVDSLHLSKNFGRVIAIERDPELAAIARENFRRLGTSNIEVVNTSAEEFCRTFIADSANRTDPDLIYADPDRRDGSGKKMVRLEDCSPDIVALLPVLRQIAPRIAVKLSPLFDVDEVFRIFGPHTCTEVVSLDDECKEIVVETAAAITSPVLRAVAINLGEAEYPHTSPTPAASSSPTRPFEAERRRYLIVPDVALQKTRLARRYFSQNFPLSEVYIDSDNGYGFSAQKLELNPKPEHSPNPEHSDSPGKPMCKVLEIALIEPFNPKSLKQCLKAEGIKSIDILRRNFPLSTTEIARRLTVGEGGTTSIAFTSAAGQLWQIIIK